MIIRIESIHKLIKLISKENKKPTLKKDGEVDERNDGGDHHLLGWYHVLIDDQNQCKGHRTAQPAIAHDELLNAAQLVQSKAIRNRRKQNHACKINK